MKGKKSKWKKVDNFFPKGTKANNAAIINHKAMLSKQEDFRRINPLNL